ncbi:MAG: hypothetical protein ACYDCK_14830 [Thermoplasmatota archaeon]
MHFFGNSTWTAVGIPCADGRLECWVGNGTYAPFHINASWGRIVNASLDASWTSTGELDRELHVFFGTANETYAKANGASPMRLELGPGVFAHPSMFQASAAPNVPGADLGDVVHFTLTLVVQREDRNV